VAVVVAQAAEAEVGEAVPEEVGAQRLAMQPSMGRRSAAAPKGARVAVVPWSPRLTAGVQAGGRARRSPTRRPTGVRVAAEESPGSARRSLSGRTRRRRSRSKWP
jgi:hypothetical protein